MGVYGMCLRSILKINVRTHGLVVLNLELFFKMHACAF